MRIRAGFRPSPGKTPEVMPDRTGLVQRPNGVRTLRTIGALVLREMSTSYGRNIAGYLWAVLEPAAGIILMTLVFSLIFRAPPIGTSFALFYASGLLPFLAYMDISQKVATSLRFSKALLAYPGVTYFDALIARWLLNAVTQIMVFVLVIGAIFGIFRVEVILDIPAICLGGAMVLALALGVGAMNCLVQSLFPVWERVWAILNRPMLILSCVFFPFVSVPEPYRSWLWWNPLVHVVGQIRKGIYATYSGDYLSPAYVFAVSLGLTAAALLLLNRFHSDIVNR
jgi:capsular polysaccharide transport system permease protein